MDLAADVSIPASCALLALGAVWFARAARRETDPGWKRAFLGTAIACVGIALWLVLT